jgi:hypothetical protein
MSSRSSRLSHEVAAIRQGIAEFLDAIDPITSRKPANAKCGVYVFYDYDGEPIYVGQTYERLRTRIRRHLTNQRTDAVAMNVLDPFEVLEIELYPFFELDEPRAGETSAEFQLRRTRTLENAEFTVYRKVLGESSFGAVLNEAEIPDGEIVGLPTPFRGRIVPEDLYQLRKHPDVRIARRASTIANLARVISERDVSPGLRRTLSVQASRLERLSQRRYRELLGNTSNTGVDDNEGGRL